MSNSSKIPWAAEPDGVLKDLGVLRDRGLVLSEVRKRLGKHGPNRLASVKRKSLRLVLAGQFKNVIMGLLAAAAAASFIFGEWMEGFSVLGVMVINAAIGFVTEVKAIRSMDALREMGRTTTRVRRGGKVREVPAEELVPGDIVILEGGDIITADLRILTASRLQVDESPLTGESLPVSKDEEVLPEDTPLADRANMLFMGTALTRGSGEGVVVATGMETELGRITSLVEEAEAGATPLEERLDRLGRKLIWVTAIVAAAVAVSGIVTGKGVYLMIETAIALAVATIPEGLPIVATIALARGVLRMARRNALVKQLSAVETLGATTLICTDKTGTLTENRMTVDRLALEGGDIPREEFSRKADPRASEILTVVSLCNNASLSGEGEGSGDPLEVALLAAAKEADLDPDRLRKDRLEEREEAFDSESKLMATFNRDGSGYLVAVKGAPEEVLGASSKVRTDQGESPMGEEERERWLKKNREMAGEGFRVLAAAVKTTDDLKAPPYRDLTFLGLIGLLDPPRREIKDVLESCRRGGVRVVMVTGDQPVTAGLIAREVGLTEEEEPRVIHGRDLKPPEELSAREREEILEASLFARVSHARL